MIILYRLTFLFGAGALGGLIHALVMWFTCELGFASHFHVRMDPELDLEFIYPKIIWGGLWGFLFYFPYLERFSVIRGIAVSLIPTVVAFFFFFPIVHKVGIMGERLGQHAYWMIALWNMVWGISVSAYLKILNTSLGNR